MILTEAIEVQTNIIAEQTYSPMYGSVIRNELFVDEVKFIDFVARNGSAIVMRIIIIIKI